MAGANNDYPILDKIAPSWADVTCKVQPLNGSLLVTRDFKSINSGATLDIGVQMAGGRVKQTTVGSLTNTFSFTLYLSGAQAFEKALRDVATTAGYVRDGGVVQIGLVFFQFDYLFTPPGSDDIFERRLKGCRLMSDAEASAEGTDAMTVDYTAFVTERVKVIDNVEYALI